MKFILFKIIHFLIEFEQSFRYRIMRKSYQIPSDFRFNGREIKLYGKGSIKIGKNSYIGSYSTINAEEGYKVVLGENCSISHNVRMYTSSNIPDQDFNSNAIKRKNYGDIIIGSGVWIGANVFINPGIKVGNNVVVGANSVITKNLEENGIYAGCPARLIRSKNV